MREVERRRKIKLMDILGKDRKVFEEDTAQRVIQLQVAKEKLNDKSVLGLNGALRKGQRRIGDFHQREASLGIHWAGGVGITHSDVDDFQKYFAVRRLAVETTYAKGDWNTGIFTKREVEACLENWPF